MDSNIEDAFDKEVDSIHSWDHIAVARHSDQIVVLGDSNMRHRRVEIPSAEDSSLNGAYEGYQAES